jgi:Asp-tRNA(Asn)/Glu-tRNA(Gln) amidotransferase A subunit family amidase
MKAKKRAKKLDSEELCFLPALKLRDGIRKKFVSPVEVIKTFLDRIEKINPIIHAYCTIVPELALKLARRAEAEIMRNKSKMGMLHGVPVSIKDVTLTAGIRTTFGSKL